MAEFTQKIEDQLSQAGATDIKDQLIASGAKPLQAQALVDVLTECKYQYILCGEPDDMTEEEWTKRIVELAATFAIRPFKDRMTKVAALAVAAIEWKARS